MNFRKLSAKSRKVVSIFKSVCRKMLKLSGCPVLRCTRRQGDMAVRERERDRYYIIAERDFFKGVVTFHPFWSCHSCLHPGSLFGTEPWGKILISNSGNRLRFSNHYVPCYPYKRGSRSFWKGDLIISKEMTIW